MFRQEWGMMYRWIFRQSCTCSDHHVCPRCEILDEVQDRADRFEEAYKMYGVKSE